MKKEGLLDLLARLPPLNEDFPDADIAIGPLDDVDPFAAPPSARNRTVLGCGEGTVVVRGSLTEPGIPLEDWEMLSDEDEEPR